MTITRHPGYATLLDYASGALAEPWSIAVATHLALCPVCRRAVRDMEAIGGALLADDAEIHGSSQIHEPAQDFDALLARIDQAEANPEPRPAVDDAPSTGARRVSEGGMVFPRPLRDYAGGDVGAVKWQRLGPGAWQYILPTGQPTGEQSAIARLLRIPAGRPVPEHSHGGPEFTLVLSGAFSDASGTYGRGDFQEADPSVEHMPVAARGEDCICLAVTDAPLRFKSLAARIAQPFLGI